MAIYHASTKSISRSSGRSSVASAAYRAADKLCDERTGTLHDYSRKGGVVLTQLITPYGGTTTRSELWNSAEASEKRKDARTAREWIVALPDELNKEERTELARHFAVELSSRYQIAVDLAIHTPGKEGDQRNHHAHLLCTTRQISWSADGQIQLGNKASIELSDTKRRSLGMGRVADEITAVRQLWEALANGALLKAGQEARIDSRSFKERGIEQEPTQHLGPVSSAMERRGRRSERGSRNRQIAEDNARRPARKEALNHEIKLLGAEKQRIEWAAKVMKLPAMAMSKAWDDELANRANTIAERAKLLAWKTLKAIREVEAKREHLRESLVKKYRAYQAIEWDFLGVRRMLYEKRMHEYETANKEMHKTFENRLSDLSRRYEIFRNHDNWGGAYRYLDPTKNKAERSMEHDFPELARMVGEAREVVAKEQERQREERQRIEQSQSRGRGRGR